MEKIKYYLPSIIFSAAEISVILLAGKLLGLKPEEMLEDMKDSYGAYSESRDAYSRGNYGAGEDSMKALEDTMELFTEFAQKMIQEVESPEAKQIIKKHLRKISQMGAR